MVDFMLLHRLQFKHPAYLILRKKANSRQIVSTLYFCVARKRKSIARFLCMFRSEPEAFFVLLLEASHVHGEARKSYE